MKNFLILGLIVDIFLIIGLNTTLLAQEVASQEVKIVMGEGSTPIYDNNLLQAKDAALGIAKRNAVENAVGSLVAAQTVVDNYQTISDKILTKTGGYIKKYEIIAEKQQNELYTVKIKAEVTIENIKDDLIALNLLQEAMKKPRVMVMIKEKSVGDYNNTGSISETVISDKFIKKEFNLVDAAQVDQIRRDSQAQLALTGNVQAAAALGAQLGAEVIIVGEAQVQSNPIGIQGVNMLTCQATIATRAIQASTGKVLVAKSSEAKVAHINELTGSKKALEEAAGKVSDMLIEEIIKVWNSELMNASLIQVNLFDITYADFSTVIARLKTLQGVDSVYERQFTDMIGRLDVSFRGDIQQLIKRLLNLKFDKLKLEVKTVQSHRVDLKAEKLNLTP